MTFAITIPYMDSLIALPGGQITAFIAILVILALAFEIILSILLKILGFIVGKTKTTLDDRVLKVLGAYLPAISIVTSLWISLEAVYPGMVISGNMGEFDIYVIAMLAIGGFLISSLADAVLLWYGVELRPRKKPVRDAEIFPFVRNVVKIAIIIVFIVFILQRLGFDTTAIITGLGIGGLAVALALQDTLANFFGGVHILVDKPFKEEDYIKMDALEGTVKQIGWRTTRLLTPSGNEIIVPNSKLAGSALENYSSPNELSGVTYTVGVDYKEDMDSVEKLITETLHKTAKKTGMIDETSIWVRFDSFGDYSLNFKFGYFVKGYIHRFAVLKEMNRELFYAFKKNKVNIPFPVRVIYNEKK
ncbi:MAG: mechanosensitive ion channel family protein [Candidatus ainarchaeum sp.]|nr:mechanosensitive ion channel family protein [Candidatus ainarchaeum sp.]